MVDHTRTQRLESLPFLFQSYMLELEFELTIEFNI